MFEKYFDLQDAMKTTDKDQQQKPVAGQPAIVPQNGMETYHEVKPFPGIDSPDTPHPAAPQQGAGSQRATNTVKNQEDSKVPGQVDNYNLQFMRGPLSKVDPNIMKDPRARDAVKNFLGKVVDNPALYLDLKNRVLPNARTQDISARKNKKK